MISLEWKRPKAMSDWERYSLLHYLAENPIYLVGILVVLVLVSIFIGFGASALLQKSTVPAQVTKGVAETLHSSKTAVNIGENVLLPSELEKSKVFIAKIRDFVVANKTAVLSSLMVFAVLSVLFVITCCCCLVKNEEADILDPEQPVDALDPQVEDEEEEGRGFSIYGYLFVGLGLFGSVTLIGVLLVEFGVVKSDLLWQPRLLKMWEERQLQKEHTEWDEIQRKHQNAMETLCRRLEEGERARKERDKEQAQAWDTVSGETDRARLKRWLDKLYDFSCRWGLPPVQFKSSGSCSIILDDDVTVQYVDDSKDGNVLWQLYSHFRREHPDSYFVI